MSNLAKDWQEGTYTIRVKEGEVEVSTIRTVTKTYLTCASNIHKKYVAIARYAPEDEFSLSMGVALAMDRLNKLLKDEFSGIKVGDKVKIKDGLLSYTTPIRWIKKNLDNVELAACFAYGQIPNEDDTVYVVKVIAPGYGVSEEGKNNRLAYVQRYFKFFDGNVSDNEACYLIDIDGLEKV